jgi:hypothetical protein
MHRYMKSMYSIQSRMQMQTSQKGGITLLSIYNKVRAVPSEAQKPIQGGRLKGMTDINPMWRIKALTELFGPCGIGWKYTITEKRLESGANDEIAVFVDINLYIKYQGEWSEAIPGTGGSMFVAKESRGLYTSDECFKMALTDAISVACKSLGVGADVYWEKDRTKYTGTDSEQLPPKQTQSQQKSGTISEKQAKRMFAIAGNPKLVQDLLTAKGYAKSTDVKVSEYDAICKELEKMKGAK